MEIGAGRDEWMKKGYRQFLKVLLGIFENND